MDIQEVKHKLENTINVFKEDLNGIQAGKVTETLLKNISIIFEDGRKNNLFSIAKINVIDKQSLSVHPFCIADIVIIEKCIANSGLNVNTGRQNNIIIITFPEITKERREELAKSINEFANKAKQSARNIRQHFLQENKANTKEEKIKIEKEIQPEIEKFNKKIDDLTIIKQNELLKI